MKLLLLTHTPDVAKLQNVELIDEVPKLQNIKRIVFQVFESSILRSSGASIADDLFPSDLRIQAFGSQI